MVISMYIILIIFLILVSFLIFKIFEYHRGKRVFNIASESENEGNFEGACYYYAIAATAGFKTGICNKKLIHLWKSYGPFDFSIQRENIISKHCTYATCGEGFNAIILDYIKSIVDQ